MVDVPLQKMNFDAAGNVVDAGEEDGVGVEFFDDGYAENLDALAARVDVQDEIEREQDCDIVDEPEESEEEEEVSDDPEADLNPGDDPDFVPSPPKKRPQRTTRAKHPRYLGENSSEEEEELSEEDPGPSTRGGRRKPVQQKNGPPAKRKAPPPAKKTPAKRTAAKRTAAKNSFGGRSSLPGMGSGPDPEVLEVDPETGKKVKKKKKDHPDYQWDEVPFFEQEWVPQPNPPPGFPPEGGIFPELLGLDMADVFLKLMEGGLELWSHQTNLFAEKMRAADPSFHWTRMELGEALIWVCDSLMVHSF